jgi:hypothetical protein
MMKAKSESKKKESTRLVAGVAWYFREDWGEHGDVVSMLNR